MSVRSRGRRGCRAIVTTQACEKIYRAAGGTAEVAARLDVGDRRAARLAAAGDDPVRRRARSARRLDADLAPGATLLAVEAVDLRPRRRMGETVRAGSLPRSLAHPPRRQARLRRRPPLRLAPTPRSCAAPGRPRRRQRAMATHPPRRPTTPSAASSRCAPSIGDGGRRQRLERQASRPPRRGGRPGAPRRAHPGARRRSATARPCRKSGGSDR